MNVFDISTKCENCGKAMITTGHFPELCRSCSMKPVVGGQGRESETIGSEVEAWGFMLLVGAVAGVCGGLVVILAR